jgi:hypothetical protein
MGVKRPFDEKVVVAELLKEIGGNSELRVESLELRYILLHCRNHKSNGLYHLNSQL